MSFVKRGNVWWVDVSVPGKKRIRRSTGTEDRKQAQEYHDKLKADLWRQVKLGEKPERYWEEAALQWMKDKSHKATAVEDARKVAWFDARLKGKKLSQLTSDFIREVVEDGLAEVSPSTRNRYYAVIRGILRAAWKRGWIEAAPFIQCHQEPKGIVKWATPGQVYKAAELMPAYIAPVFVFALATGLRMRNITHLEWADVDLEKRKAIVGRTKNGDPLAVPLNDKAIEILSGIAGREGRVFRNRYGKPFDNANTPEFRAALGKAGIVGRFRFHDTRHTWASWMIQNGVSERVSTIT